LLLLDGVKYEEWVPEREEQLERMVDEHAEEIFGENSIYLDKKQKLKSIAGVGSVPDGLVIMFGNIAEWHIVEVEMSSHDPYSHIVPQVDRFLNGIENRNTRNKIIEALYDAIYGDEFLKLKTRQEIGKDRDVHKFIADLISGQPTITIIIEKYTEQLKEALRKYTQKKVVQFQTFTREGVGLPVHAHLFEPLYKSVTYTRSEFVPPLSPLPNEMVEVTLQQDGINCFYIDIPRVKKLLFPDSKTVLELETDIGLMEVGFNTGNWGTRLQKYFKEWFIAHPELKPGDKVRITAIEPMKKYRLEIVKG
jgi:hypothetical protein